MVWKIKLVDVNGTAVAKKVWAKDCDAPRTLQEACLGQYTKPRDIYCGTDKIAPAPFSQTPTHKEPMPFNPVNTDYSYMRYAASLGAGGDVCGWSEADRIPDLFHSRESSPASTSSSSGSSIASPSSYTGGSPFPSARWEPVTKYQGAFTHTGCPSHLSLSEFDTFSNPVPLNPRASTYAEDCFPESDVSYQLVELQESFINPFTNQEFYEEV